MDNPNTHLANLITAIEGAIDANTWKKVYFGKMAPEKHKRYISVFYMGTNTKSAVATAGGGEPGQDFLVVLFARSNGSETDLEDAERDMNLAEYQIVKTITEDRDNSWLKAYVPYPTFRPRQPRGLPRTRLAEIPFRLISR